MARYTAEEALEMICDESDSGGELDIEEDLSFPLPHLSDDNEGEPSPSPSPYLLPLLPLSPSLSLSSSLSSQSDRSRSPSPLHSSRGRTGRRQRG